MSVRKLRSVVLILALVAGFIAISSWNLALADVLKSDTPAPGGVANNQTVTLLTVPASQVYYAKSVVISNTSNTTASDCATLVRNNVAITSCIVVPADGTVQIDLDPPVVFVGGQDSLQVRNVGPNTTLRFTVTGTRDVR